MRKKGKRINQNIIVKPLQVKNDKAWELPLRAAQLSLEVTGRLSDVHIKDVMESCHVLLLGGVKHPYTVHCEALLRIMHDVVKRPNRNTSELEDESILASLGMMLECITENKISNYDIAKGAEEFHRIQFMRN